MRIVLLLLFSIIYATPAFAEEVTRVAVLEFRGIGLDPDFLLKLSDQSRLAAVDVLPHETYSVMTRENMMLILDDMGKDASCMEGSCEVDIGRNIGADYVVTGNVMWVEDKCLLTLKLYETKTGKLLAGKEVKKERLLDLVEETRAMSLELYGAGFGVETGLEKLSAAKPLYWVGAGLLIASSASAGVAYQTKKNYLETPNPADAQSIDTTNQITSIGFPILLGLSATSFSAGWLIQKKEQR